MCMCYTYCTGLYVSLVLLVAVEQETFKRERRRSRTEVTGRESIDIEEGGRQHRHTHTDTGR